MAQDAAPLDGGFADPVFDSQSVFRALMDAMARPGRPVAMAAKVVPPHPLLAPVGAVICAIADADTPIWLDLATATGQGVLAWTAFHTGTPIVSDPGRAVLAVVADASAMPSLDKFMPGSQEYPDRSATVLIQLPSLEGGQPLTLAGPGIDGAVTFGPVGLPAGFAAQWQQNSALFPRGIDLIFAAGNRVVCLPRSSRLVGSGVKACT